MANKVAMLSRTALLLAAEQHPEKRSRMPLRWERTQWRSGVFLKQLAARRRPSCWLVAKTGSAAAASRAPDSEPAEGVRVRDDKIH